MTGASSLLQALCRQASCARPGRWPSRVTIAEIELALDATVHRSRAAPPVMVAQSRHCPPGSPSWPGSQGRGGRPRVSDAPGRNACRRPARAQESSFIFPAPSSALALARHRSAARSSRAKQIDDTHRPASGCKAGPLCNGSGSCSRSCARCDSRYARSCLPVGKSAVMRRRSSLPNTLSMASTSPGGVAIHLHMTMQKPRRPEPTGV